MVYGRVRESAGRCMQETDQTLEQFMDGGAEKAVGECAGAVRRCLDA